jgi:hypothetical protein
VFESREMDGYEKSYKTEKCCRQLLSCARETCQDEFNVREVSVELICIEKPEGNKQRPICMTRTFSPRSAKLTTLTEVALSRCAATHKFEGSSEVLNKIIIVTNKVCVCINV